MLKKKANPKYFVVRSFYKGLLNHFRIFQVIILEYSRILSIQVPANSSVGVFKK